MIDRVTEIVGEMIGLIFGSRSGKILKKLSPLVEATNDLEKTIAKLTDRQLRAKTDEFRNRLGQGEALNDLLPEAFACVREAGKRTLGMRHFDVQLIGGAVLHRGMIAEMVTGEGKTLVATLPSYLNALVRKPGESATVHVVTVNDYLARRDADWNRPIFELLGLTCGAIQSEMDSEQRHPIYACDIVYGTNSEFGFDYLRDNMKMDPWLQVQKRRHFAIIDEVDSILIDEARTPLIISGAPDVSTDKYDIAARLADHLKRVPEEEVHQMEEARIRQMLYEPKIGHYVADEKDHTVALTEAGIHEAERFLNIPNFYAGEHMDWPHFIDNALKAKELYRKEDEYSVIEGKVIIVDEFTGRLMHGRRWSDGLHQAVEAKERLAGEQIEIEGENQTLATITIQNFFKLYDKLAGMTGTAMTESREFGKIYKLEVVSIPTNKPLRRVNHPDVIYGSTKEKYDAICAEIENCYNTGRPILVGTTSIEKSVHLAGMLERRGFKDKFEVLNAKQHAREANIVAVAGRLGAITIATNMAGRGTDIILGEFDMPTIVRHWQAVELAPGDLTGREPRPEVEKRLYRHWAEHYLSEDQLMKLSENQYRAALEKYWKDHYLPPLRIGTRISEMGGLHIVGTERHEARRIDNQLRGRAGRQGDPGSSRFFLSLEDDLMRIFAKDWVRRFLQRTGMKDGIPLESRMVSRSIEKAQRKVEEHHFAVRRRLLEYDEVMNEQRKLIYGLRQQVLEAQTPDKAGFLKQTMSDWIEDVIALAVRAQMPPGDLPSDEQIAGLCAWAKRKFLVELVPSELTGKMGEELEDAVIARVKAFYGEREKALGELDVSLDRSAADPAWIERRKLLASACAKAFAGITQNDFDFKPGEDGKVPEALLAKFQRIVDWAKEHGVEIGTAEDLTRYKSMNQVRDWILALVESVDPERPKPEVVRLPKMRLLERFLMLDIIDKKWKDHLYGMDVLKEGIHLRGYAQKDPKLEYKREGFNMFMDMFNNLKETAADLLFKMEVTERVEKQEVEDVWKADQQQTVHEEGKSVFEGAKEVHDASEHGGSEIKPIETIRREDSRVGPNDPCPCGSGRKHKKCCGRRMGGPGAPTTRGRKDAAPPTTPAQSGGRKGKAQAKG